MALFMAKVALATGSSVGIRQAKTDYISRKIWR